MNVFNILGHPSVNTPPDSYYVNRMDLYTGKTIANRWAQ